MKQSSILFLVSIGHHFTAIHFISRYDYARIPLFDSLEIFHEKITYFIRFDGLEDVRATAGEESVDHGKARILRRCPDESHDPFFYPREEDILLTLRPTVDLIEKEDGLTSL